MALSDLAVRQAKATGKAYTLPDLDGLSLAVTAAGGRTWHFRYYWAGKQKRMSLGTYPEVTDPSFHVVAYDFGVKRNILRILVEHGCRPWLAADDPRRGRRREQPAETGDGSENPNAL